MFLAFCVESILKTAVRSQGMLLVLHVVTQ